MLHTSPQLNEVSNSNHGDHIPTTMCLQLVESGLLGTNDVVRLNTFFVFCIGPEKLRGMCIFGLTVLKRGEPTGRHVITSHGRKQSRRPLPRFGTPVKLDDGNNATFKTTVVDVATTPCDPIHKNNRGEDNNWGSHLHYTPEPTNVTAALSSTVHPPWPSEFHPPRVLAFLSERFSGQDWYVLTFRPPYHNLWSNHGRQTKRAIQTGAVLSSPTLPGVQAAQCEATACAIGFLPRVCACVNCAGHARVASAPGRKLAAAEEGRDKFSCDEESNENDKQCDVIAKAPRPAPMVAAHRAASSIRHWLVWCTYLRIVLSLSIYISTTVSSSYALITYLSSALSLSLVNI